MRKMRKIRKVSVLIISAAAILSSAACAHQEEAKEDIQNAVMENEEQIDSEEESSSQETKEGVSEEGSGQEAADNNESEEASASADGIRPEFKEAMDAYEAFYDQYCDFMKKYNEDPTDLKLLAEYTDMLSKAADMDETFEAWEEDELSSEELKYYLDVNNRIAQKLVDVSE